MKYRKMETKKNIEIDDWERRWINETNWKEETIEHAQSEAIEQIAPHVDELKYTPHIKAYALLACVYTEMLNIIDRRYSDIDWCVEELERLKEWLKRDYEAKIKKNENKEN